MTKARLFLCAFSCFFCTVCAFAQSAPQPQTTTVWQYGLPGHQFVVTNATPWFSRISVGASGNKKTKVFVDLAPNETAATATKGGKKHAWWKTAVPFSGPQPVVRYGRSSNIDLPIAALFYTDAQRTRYIGATVSIFMLPGYGASSVNSLIIKPENIWFADDVDRAELAEAAQKVPRTLPAEKPLDINYAAAQGLGIQMFVWNSPTPAHIVVNGASQGWIHEGETYYLAGRSPVTITLMAQDGNGQLRTWSQSFINQNWFNVTARVAVLGAQDLR